MEHIGRYLRDIYFDNKRGQLTFRYQNIQKYLYFQDGNLVFTKTNQRPELLGEVLYRLGKLSQEAYQNIEEYIEPMEIIGQVRAPLATRSVGWIDLSNERSYAEHFPDI
jgi:hypothetical protein